METSRLPVSADRPEPPATEFLEPRFTKTQFLRVRVVRHRQFAIAVVAAAVFGFLSLTADQFLTTDNLVNVLRQVSFTTIVGVGMTYVFIAGELDLSVGSMYGLMTIVLGKLIVDGALDPWLAAALVVVLAGGIGAVNGVVTTWIRVPSFIVTLAMLSLLKGINLVMTSAFPIPYPDAVVSSSFFQVTGGRWMGIPAQVFWMVGIVAVGHVLLSKTIFGYHVYATGGNARASRSLGVNTALVKTWTFILTGMLVGVVAALNAGWLHMASPTTGTGFELDVIAAVIIGGTALYGGLGTVYGTFMGAFILGMLKIGIVLLGLNAFWDPVGVGGIIALAAILGALVQRRTLTRSNGS